MEIIVYKILICQVKDKDIPQLIPLLWVYSSVIILLIGVIVINLYRVSLNKEVSLGFFIRVRKNNLWFW